MTFRVQTWMQFFLNWATNIRISLIALAIILTKTMSSSWPDCICVYLIQTCKCFRDIEGKNLQIKSSLAAFFLLLHWIRQLLSIAKANCCIFIFQYNFPCVHALHSIILLLVLRNLRNFIDDFDVVQTMCNQIYQFQKHLLDPSAILRRYLEPLDFFKLLEILIYNLCGAFTTISYGLPIVNILLIADDNWESGVLLVLVV